MKSPAFYKTDLEARTDFVCARHKFLKTVKEAVLLEEHDEDAARFLEIFANNGYTAILMRLLKDKATDAKTRSKLLLVIGNLLSSVNTKVSQAAVVAVNKEMETVFAALNSTNKKHQKSAAFIVMNFAKHKDEGEIEVTLRNLNDTQFYTQASAQALRDILWAHVYSKNESLLTYTNLVAVIENHLDRLPIVYPAIEILAGRSDEEIPVEFQERLVNALTNLLANSAVKDKLRQWVYFNLANLVVEDGVSKMEFLSPPTVSLLRKDIERHFEVGADFQPFAVEAFWCVGNAIAKMDPNPFALENLYLFHELTRILRHVDVALDDYSLGKRRNDLAKVVDESFAILRKHREQMSSTAVYNWLYQQYIDNPNGNQTAVAAIYAELHRLLNKEPSCVDDFVSHIDWLLEMSKRQETDAETVTEKLRLLTFAVLDCVNDEMEIEAATLLYNMLKYLSSLAPTFLPYQVEDAFEILDRVIVEAHNGETEVAEDDETEVAEDEDDDMPDFSKVRVHWFNATDPSGVRVREVPYVDLCEFIAENECEAGQNTVTIYWRLMPTVSYSQAVVSRDSLFEFVTTNDFDRISALVSEVNMNVTEPASFLEEQEKNEKVKDAKDESEDMEIDDDASAFSMPALEPMSAPVGMEETTEAEPMSAFEEGFYVSSAIDLMMGFGRFNASRTVFEIINLISANNCAPTPIPSTTTLTIKDLVMLERLGFLVNRGMVAINPYVAVATGVHNA